MFKPIVCKAKTNITIPYSGTKKEKLEFIDRTARTFCENFDTYLQINNQKNFIKKKELIALFSELFPGLKINIGRVSSKEAGTDAATRREEDCYIMHLKPLKSKNMLVNILDYFRPLKIEKNPDNIESIKHETCHIISQSVRGNAFKNNDTSLLNERQLTLYDSYINTLAQITSPDNTQWQNELAIHDYLVSHITYTDGIPGNSYAYNAMIDGTAVCSGYAESFKTFMDFLGIENITVSGTARGEKHIWNMVCLDGEWYHTDVTWDDPVNGREDYIEHAYFNITDNDISLDHSWEYSSTPAASADIYSYKSIAGLANIADISTLNSIVASAVNRREPFVEFTSSIPLDVTDAFTNINTNLTYYYKNIRKKCPDGIAFHRYQSYNI